MKNYRQWCREVKNRKGRLMRKKEMENIEIRSSSEKTSLIKKLKLRKEQKKIEDFKNKTELEKVEKRREEVLSKGRKFKYPLQYAKYRIVTLTIIISVVAILLMGGFLYLSLYKWQSMDPVLYRLTQLVPFPVASVETEQVRYSDYLMIYKSTITPIEKQQGKLGSEKDTSLMEAHYKRMALSEAEKYAYALKIAGELNLTVDRDEIDQALDNHRKIGGVERSEESFKKILEDNFGLTIKEYRRMLYLSLVKEKVSQRIDDEAIKLSERIQTQIAAGKSLKVIAEEIGGKVLYEETGGLVDKMNVDGGRALTAMKLEAGKTSGRFISSSGDGYYFVSLISKTDSSVNYTSIKVPFSEFDKRLKKIRDEGGIREWIVLKGE